MSIMLSALVLLLGCAPQALAGISSVNVLGDIDAGAPATLAFGVDPSTSTVVRSRLGALEVARQNEVLLSLAGQVTKLPHTFLAGDLSVAAMGLGGFNAGGVQQWTLWDFDSFDTVDSGQWSPNDHSFCGAPHDLFLGGHCRFAATTTKRIYMNLPPHSRVRVRARVHYLDEWNGESVSLMAHGAPVWSQAHHWCPGFLQRLCNQFGIDTCGRDGPDRLSVKAEATFAHSGPGLDLSFNSSLAPATDACYTSWGVDDVSVELLG